MTGYITFIVFLLVVATNQSHATPIDNHNDFFSRHIHQNEYLSTTQEEDDIYSYDKNIKVTKNGNFNIYEKIRFIDFVDEMPFYFERRPFLNGAHETNPVPEPSTLILLGAGFIVLSVFGKKILS